MLKDFGEKINKKLVKSEAKMKQKLLESGEKISLFESVFGAQHYRNDSDNFSFFFFDTFNFTGLGDSVKAY